MNKIKLNYETMILSILFGLLFSVISYELRVLTILNLVLIFISMSIIEMFIYNEKDTSTLQILEINQDKNMRCLKISMVNDNLLDGEDLFRGIYETIMNNSEFLTFGFQKIIILSVILASNKEHNLHSNILIDNETTFDDYYLNVYNELDKYNTLQYGYHNEEIIRYVIKTWNVDNKKNLKIKESYNAVEDREVPLKSRQLYYKSKHFNQKRSYSTTGIDKSIGIASYGVKWYKGLINPIKIHNKLGKLKQTNPNVFFTMDLETIYLEQIKGEVPIAITSCGFFKGKLDEKIFLIDNHLLMKDHELALKQLWNKYFSYLEIVINNENTIKDKLVIFAHNLGDFDGYFLYRGLLNHFNPDHINSIIDEANTFISIQHKLHPIIEWKDSLRIFPMSLNKLCKMFGEIGKNMEYNPKFRDLNMFNNPRLLNSFKKYALQDARALFDALFSAQLIYWDKFHVDLQSVYSTATLSLKIYRTKFQDKKIFILPPNLDSFSRNGYFGGGTDVYIAYGQNIYYYDVNSLYPFAAQQC